MFSFKEKREKGRAEIKQKKIKTEEGEKFYM